MSIGPYSLLCIGKRDLVYNTGTHTTFRYWIFEVAVSLRIKNDTFRTNSTQLHTATQLYSYTDS